MSLSEALAAQSHEGVSKFTHEPLDLATRSIRVIKILCGPRDSLIQCTVEHIPLFDSHICLSYTWGGPRDKKIILLNGKQHMIQRNLWDFLWIARANGISDALWVDAISIDQRNTAERNHQVQQMAEIFQHAARVLVWLGSGDRRIENTLGVISIFCHQFRNARENDWRVPRRALDLASSRFWSSYDALDKLQYWTRLWIVQEIHHAKKALLLYGDSMCQWDHYRWLGLLVGRSRAKLKRRYPHIPRLRLVSGLSGLAFPEKSDFAELLRSFGTFQCADIRDRIFALLSLAKHGQGGQEFLVNYHLDPLQLFLQANQFWSAWADQSFPYDLFKALEMAPAMIGPQQLKKCPGLLSQTIEPKFCLTLKPDIEILCDVLAVNDALFFGLLTEPIRGSNYLWYLDCCHECRRCIEYFHSSWQQEFLREWSGVKPNRLETTSVFLCADTSIRIYIQQSKNRAISTLLDRFRIIICADPSVLEMEHGKKKPFTMEIFLSPGPDNKTALPLHILEKTWFLRLWEGTIHQEQRIMRIGLLTGCAIDGCCFRDRNASGFSWEPLGNVAILPVPAEQSMPIR